MDDELEEETYSVVFDGEHVCCKCKHKQLALVEVSEELLLEAIKEVLRLREEGTDAKPKSAAH